MRSAGGLQQARLCARYQPPCAPLIFLRNFRDAPHAVAQADHASGPPELPAPPRCPLPGWSTRSPRSSSGWQPCKQSRGTTICSYTAAVELPAPPCWPSPHAVHEGMVAPLGRALGCQPLLERAL